MKAIDFIENQLSSLDDISVGVLEWHKAIRLESSSFALEGRVEVDGGILCFGFDLAGNLAGLRVLPKKSARDEVEPLPIGTRVAENSPRPGTVVDSNPVKTWIEWDKCQCHGCKEGRGTCQGARLDDEYEVWTEMLQLEVGVKK